MLWSPDPARAAQTAMARFIAEANERVGNISDYDSLWQWSVSEPEAFWRMMLEHSGIEHGGSMEPTLEPRDWPGSRYFPNVTLSFPKNLLRHRDDKPALISVSESRATHTITHAELYARVAGMAAALRDAGVSSGDRVAGFVPNTDEAIVAMLAATSLGAVWSSCSPDFGVQGVLDRFGQIEPKVLFAANGYVYDGKKFDCIDKLEKILSEIDSIETVVLFPYLADHPCEIDDAVLWDEFTRDDVTDIDFAELPFNHPLYIMYSSGTTGLPKSIVHGAGGTLLQHAKEHLLHTDLTRDDNLMYFTTCGWMMWNWQVSSLFAGNTVTLYDGLPGVEALWQTVAEHGVTHFGTSPKFLRACRGKVRPGEQYHLSHLRVLLSTGAPLVPEDYDWIYGEVKQDIMVASITGGTDLISCFALGNPVLPVYRGEIQCCGLGMDVIAADGAGDPVVGEKGELACRTPFPSAPIHFWRDDDNARYRKAYFERVPGIWYHGDYIEMTGSQGACGGMVVYGRSDATLNPGGVRIGTAEIYRLVASLDEIDDSIVVGQPWQGDVRVVLFVKLASSATWSDALGQRIKDTIRAGATPRHVPAVVAAVPDIPYTISGKKVELAVLDVLAGREPKNTSALKNPEALDGYRDLTL